MAVTIVFTSNSVKFNPTNERVWNIGTPKPIIDVMGKVKVLEASDDELTLIRTSFKNIPDTVGNYVVYREPWAQFIWDNLS